MNKDGFSDNAMKIAEIQRMMEQMRVQHSRPSVAEEEKFSISAVMGNFPLGISFRDAEMWVQEKIQALCHVVPEVFCKGEFEGILFAKFDSSATRDRVVA